LMHTTSPPLTLMDLPEQPSACMQPISSINPIAVLCG
jgi:hypothetical protein